MKNDISIIMYSLNAEDTIANTIDSVLNQSYPYFDFIIIDNNSTDKTKSIINSYKDKRICLINSSLSYNQSLNIGLENSSGKYIALIDTDSIMHVDRLKLQHSIMEEFPSITIASSWEVIFGEDMPRRILELKFSGLIELPFMQLLLDDIVINPAYTIRRAFIDEYNLRYENYPYSEHYKFWSDAAKLNGIFYIEQQPLTYRKINNINISRKQRKMELEGMLKIKKEIVQFICLKYNHAYPALIDLYNSYNELPEYGLISYNDIFKFFHSLFSQNKDKFKEIIK